ncbi:hypothetical protein [Nocardia sp. CS682]|uniref:hypothetical protein n=1 Tax=Nocardia sp. CS682 TaxID=1047172 RepID=UPI00107533B3|nr:hypothetical protein [Nocardia sp. CS682]QBS40350.1 hypothetical protein DMB37_09720 [Nocardia sp. CS682]
MYVAITNVRTEGGDTHIESVIAAEPWRSHDRLLTVTDVDRSYGSATECHPGFGLPVFEEFDAFAGRGYRNPAVSRLFP